MTRLRRVIRGARRRCPRCGASGVFRSFFELHQRCPDCGLTFEREEGYWLGAMIVDLAITEMVFGVLFVGGMLATWPDVPWGWLLVIALVTNAVLPVALYGWSKTVWMGIDLFFTPPTAAEEAEAIAGRAAAAGAGPDGEDQPTSPS